MPGAPLPLHVFEPRYRQMTIDLVTGAVPGKQFGVVAVREGWGPDDGREGLHEIGCTAALREVRRLPDGRFDILTVGDRRFRLIDVDDSTAPYLVANVEWLPDLEGDDPAALEPLERAARAPPPPPAPPGAPPPPPPPRRGGAAEPGGPPAAAPPPGGGAPPM